MRAGNVEAEHDEREPLGLQQADQRVVLAVGEDDDAVDPGLADQAGDPAQAVRVVAAATPVDQGIALLVGHVPEGLQDEALIGLLPQMERGIGGLRPEGEHAGDAATGLLAQGPGGEARHEVQVAHGRLDGLARGPGDLLRMVQDQRDRLEAHAGPSGDVLDRHLAHRHLGSRSARQDGAPAPGRARCRLVGPANLDLYRLEIKPLARQRRRVVSALDRSFRREIRSIPQIFGGSAEPSPAWTARFAKQVFRAGFPGRISTQAPRRNRGVSRGLPNPQACPPHPTAPQPRAGAQDGRPTAGVRPLSRQPARARSRCISLSSTLRIWDRRRVVSAMGRGSKRRSAAP